MEIKPLFDIDYSIDQTQYYWFQNGFNEEEIEWVLNLKELYPFDRSTIVGSTNPSEIEHIRKSIIRWINCDDSSNWLYEKLKNFALEANNVLWKFNLHSIRDSIQYSEYFDNGGHYDWHVDIGPGSINHRKISIITQLSDPSEYEGGDLQLWSGGEFKTIPKIKGCTVLFPSFNLHRVTPITKGVRKSLVLWVGGESYK